VDNFKGNDGRLRELALFAGAGGGILGGRLLGWRTICAVEINEYCREVLVRRQNEGHLEPFPIWDDVCTFDGRPWQGRVDVISGGFPCQDISSAGRGAGIEGAKSSLWGHMARIISEVLPQYVFVENSPLLVSRGLAVVISDLAKMGYDARWGIVGADNAGAPHIRKRIWILAHSNKNKVIQKNRRSGKDSQQQGSGLPDRVRQERGEGSDLPCNCSTIQLQGPNKENSGRNTFRNNVERLSATNSRTTQSQSKVVEVEELAHSYGNRQQGQGHSDRSFNTEKNLDRETVHPVKHSDSTKGWWAVEPPVGRVADGVANRMDRLHALGNGQVPAVVALAWNLLMNLE
jgi:DNA (cytosine-5)-methyltransferase 1